MGALHEMAERYGDEVVFLVVYICEAHPTDGWQVQMKLTPLWAC